MNFLRKSEVIALQVILINTFGGLHGLRDEGALESALSAPENRAYYEEADLVACAAAYAYHLTEAHAFLDGNKRIAAHVVNIFLGMNDKMIASTISDNEIIEFFLAIAAGEISRDDVEAQLRAWIA